MLRQTAQHERQLQQMQACDAASDCQDKQHQHSLAPQQQQLTISSTQSACSAAGKRS